MESKNYKTIYSLLLLTLAFGLVNGFEFIEGHFTPCTEGRNGSLIALRTNSCDTFPQACTVYTGNTYNFEMEFETGSASTDLVSYVTGIIGIEVPWPDGPQGPSCHLITDGECPYEQGQKLIFRASIFINPLYPQVAVTGRWRLKDHQNHNHICINIPLIIRNGGGTTTTVDPPQDDPTTTNGPPITPTTNVPTTNGPTTNGPTTNGPTTNGPTTNGPTNGPTTPVHITTGGTGPTPTTTNATTTTTTTTTTPTHPDATTNGATNTNTNIYSISLLITSLLLFHC